MCYRFSRSPRPFAARPAEPFIDRPINPDPAADQLSESARWRVFVVLLASLFMTLIGISIVNVALPSIHQSLDATQSDLQWVLSGYALTFGVVLVAAGRAGDIMGRGGFFIVGVVIFTLASIACGIAPDAESLNLARFVQGVGSGIISPQGIGMIQHYFRGAARGRAFGYLGSMVGVAVAIGPVMGGVLIKLGGADFGWRLAFLVNVPVGVAVVVLAFKWFPRPLLDFRATAPDGKRVSLWHALGRLDPIGSALLGFAVFSVLYPFVEYHASIFIWLYLPIGILLVFIWVGWEKYYLATGRSPMVDLKIFSTPSFSNGALIMALYFLGMTSVWIVVALYLQEGEGKSALETGLVGIPAALLSALAAHWAGERVFKYGRRVVIGGLFIGMAGLLLSMAVVYLHALELASVWWLVVTLSLVGIAQGAVISPNQTLTLIDVPIAYAGSSGAVMQTGQRIGTSVGIAVITSALFATLGISSWPMAFMVAFGLIIAVLVVAVLLAISDWRRPRGGATRPPREAL